MVGFFDLCQLSPSLSGDRRNEHTFCFVLISAIPFYDLDHKVCRENAQADRAVLPEKNGRGIEFVLAVGQNVDLEACQTERLVYRPPMQVHSTTADLEAARRRYAKVVRALQREKTAAETILTARREANRGVWQIGMSRSEAPIHLLVGVHSVTVAPGLRKDASHPAQWSIAL